MSKSLGNSVYASQLIALARPIVVRAYLASAHYRSTIDYHPGALREAETAFARIEGLPKPGVRLAPARLGDAVYCLTRRVL